MTKEQKVTRNVTGNFLGQPKDDVDGIGTRASICNQFGKKK